MKIKKLTKLVKIEYAVSAVVLIMAVLSAVYVFRDSYYYLWNEIKMLVLSCVRLFCELFGIEYAFDININDLAVIPDFNPVVPPIGGGSGGGGIIPESIDVFKIKASIFGSMLISGGTYSNFGQVVLEFIIITCQVLMVVVPVLILLLVANKIMSLKKPNNKHGKMTLMATMIDKTSQRVIMPVGRKILECSRYFFSSIFGQCTMVLLMLNFNVFTLVLDLLAYYIYLIPSLDFGSVYQHLLKLDNYIMPFIMYFPKTLIIYYIAKFLCHKRYNRAVRVRYHLDARNMGVINRFPALYTTKGEPGAGKDYLDTDIGITKDKMSKDKSSEGMLKLDMMFPAFNWTMLGLLVKHVIDSKRIHTLYDLEEFFEARFNGIREYMSMGDQYVEDVKDLLLGYDIERYGMEYCDGIKFVSLESAVTAYAQYYYIYYLKTLIMANYTVKLDNYHLDLGNMVRACNDYFAISPQISRRVSHKCHILDVDMFRLFKKMGENKDITFECGNVLWTEFDKDYGNTLDTASDEAESDDVNSKNDGLMAQMKMIRSTATIEHDLFASVSVNAQRDMNININYREISDIINILDKPEEFYCLSGLDLELAFYHRFYRRFKAYYERYNFMRGNINAKILIYKAVFKKLFDRYTMLCNEFGYMRYSLDVNGKAQYDYYSFHKKMRSGRYKTDVNAKAFDARLMLSRFGISDLPTYSEDWISADEMKTVHSTFFNMLYNLNDKGEQSEPKDKKKSKKSIIDNDELTPMQRKHMRG